MASTAPVTDTFGGLLHTGETPEQALRRLEKSPKYTRTIGTDDGQRLLAAATSQVKDAPNGGVKPRTARTIAQDIALAPVAPYLPEVEHLQIAEIELGLIDVGSNVRVNVEELEELTASIAAHGVLQPIKLRRAGDRYTIVWGQRRFLASRQAGKATIPAIVVFAEPAADRLAIEQLVENLHRADLPPLDRARAMRQVVDAGMSQADLARELGIGATTVTNDLGLLDSPKEIQSLIAEGKLTPSHAKAVKGFAPKDQVQLARDAVANGYSAHRLEEEAQRRRDRAEREAKQEAANAEQQRKNLERIQSSIEELAQKKQPGLDAEIVVFQDYWGGGHDGSATVKQLAAKLREAGFTNVRIAENRGAPIPRPKGCTCTAWKATVHSSYSYRDNGYTTRLQVTKACVVSAHAQAAATASRKAETDRYALQDRVREHIKTTSAVQAIAEPRLFALDRTLAEGVLFARINYRLPEWSLAHGGSRNKPWDAIHALTDEQLAEELTKELVSDFRDHAGYHMGWEQLAAELGVAQEEPAS